MRGFDKKGNGVTKGGEFESCSMQLKMYNFLTCGIQIQKIHF